MNFAENEQWKNSKYLAYTVPIFVTDWRNIKKVEEAYISKQCTFMMLEHHTRHFELVLQMKHYFKKMYCQFNKKRVKNN